MSVDCKAINAFSLLQTFYTPAFNSNVKALTKQIRTKFKNGTISKIKFKTFCKLLSYNLFDNFFGFIM